MALTKLLNLFAISSFAILAYSFWFTPVNALSVDSHHLARHNARGHDAVALRKRSSTTKRCKQRPPTANTTTPAATKTPAPAPASAKAAESSSTSQKTSTANSPTSTPASSGSTQTNNGAKMGLAWANGDDPTSLSHFKTPHVSFLYTWSAHIPASAKGLGYEPMPMLWCDDQIADFQRLVVKGYANYALGMNEPEGAGQCNISPQHGAYLWKTYIEPLKDLGYTILSPAPSSAPAGKKWMQDFFAACTGCTFHGLCAHYYDITAAGMISYMEDFHQTFQLDLYITEFACQNYNGGPQCTETEIFQFMSTILKWCHETAWVKACMPFGAMRDMQGVNDLDRLMNYDGSPTDLGYLFINGGS